MQGDKYQRTLKFSELEEVTDCVTLFEMKAFFHAFLSHLLFS